MIDQFRAAIEAAGLAPPADVVADGRLHRFPTSARAHDDAGWYVLHGDRRPAGAFGDWRTGLSLTWRAGQARAAKPSNHRQVARPIPLGPKDHRRTSAALALWEEALPAAHSPVESYLASRGIRLRGTDALRFHSRLLHPTGATWPALLALVTRGHDGVPLAVHRTFLAHDGGGKARVHPCRMMLGPCRSGAVRLAAAGEVTLIGEGIETCLAAMQASGLPAWAALSTSGLRTLELPDELRDVIVLADGDPAGETAAQAAALRWKWQGRQVRIARAPQGMDFNDLLLAGEAGAP
jgi:phage/plasmid primase-like uncharacterized protein